MHEYGIAQEILHVIEVYLKGHAGFKPVKCEVQVGALSGIDPLSLGAAFPIAATGSIAEKMELLAAVEPFTCRCRNCGSETRIEEHVDMMLCESCGSADIDYPESALKIFIRGLELKRGETVEVIDFKDVEVEEEPHGPHEHEDLHDHAGMSK